MQHAGFFASAMQHASAYVSICQHTSAYVNICSMRALPCRMRQHMSAYVSIRPHTSTYAACGLLRVCHTACTACVSIRQNASAYACYQAHPCLCLPPCSQLSVPVHDRLHETHALEE
jgi:hypothetical protein